MWISTHVIVLCMPLISYVSDPASCAPGVANASSMFPGAYYRACNQSVDPSPEAAAAQITVADIVNGLPELSILAGAVNSSAPAAYGVPQLFSNKSANITLFAPSNDAFESLISVWGLSGVQALESNPNLLALLLRHVSPSVVTLYEVGNSNVTPVEVSTISPSLFNNISLDITTEYILQGLTGQIFESSSFLVLNNVVYDNTTISGFNVGAYALNAYNTSNGVVYVISGVLSLLDDVLYALNNTKGLGTFSKALNVTGVSAELGAGSACPNPTNATCSVTGVTVFAPTDEAFSSLAQSLNTTVDGLLNSTQLPNILRLHIAPNSQQPGGGLMLTPNQSIATSLPGKNLTFEYQNQTIVLFSSSLLGSLTTQQEVPVLMGPQVNGTNQGQGQGNTAVLDLANEIMAYNGMVVPISQVLLPGPVTTQSQDRNRTQVAASSGGSPSLF